MYGYSNDSLEWMASYLEDRRQIVQVEASTSKEMEVSIGFPQGGPMSPILFREYSGDIPESIHLENIEMQRENDADHEGLNQNETTESVVTLKISMKNDDEKSNDEKWDETLRIKENFINTWIDNEEK